MGATAMAAAAAPANRRGDIRVSIMPAFTPTQEVETSNSIAVSIPFEVLIVLRAAPVAAPPPAAVDEGAHRGVAGVQHPRVGAVAVEIGARGLGFYVSVAVDVGVDERVDVDCPAVGVQRPVVPGRQQPAVER